MDSKGGPAQHGAGRDAHGGPVGILGRHCVGDRSGALPTLSRRGDVAVGVAHVAATNGTQTVLT